MCFGCKIIKYFFCYALLTKVLVFCVLSSFAITSMREREREMVAYIVFLVSCLPVQIGLQCVNVSFPGLSHLIG